MIRRRHIPYIAVGFHTVLIVMVLCLVAIGGGGELVMIWNIFFLIDFPIALVFPWVAEAFPWVVQAIEECFGKFNLQLNASLECVLWFGIFGGLQYFVISWLIVRMTERTTLQGGGVGPKGRPGESESVE